MAAYVIADVQVTDPDSYASYRTMVLSTLVPYGGRFLARGGRVDIFEGDWSPERLVILEFDSLEKARAWWESPEYAQAKALRQRASNSRMVAVEGVS